jgi:ubiquitin
MSAADKNDTMKMSKQSVSCADFQDQLPDLFESGADLSQQEHLQSCAQCSALVRDLEYIAQQAKLLLPIHDPSPAVWDNIQTTLSTQKNGSNPK